MQYIISADILYQIQHICNNVEMVLIPIPKMLGKEEASDCLVKVSQMQNLRRTGYST